MYVLIKPSERPAAVGFGLLVLGLSGVAILHFFRSPHAVLFVAATCCWVIGLLVFRLAIYASWANQSLMLERVRKSANGVFWLRILGVVLWLGVLPLCLLWVYHHLR